MKRYHWLTFLLAAYALPSCHQAESPATSAEKSIPMYEPPPPAAPQQPGSLTQAVLVDAADSVAVMGASPPVAATRPVQRLLVYHADVRLKIDAMPRTVGRLDSLVRRSGGFVSSSAETRADGEWRQETTIRVSPTQFQRLLSGLSGLGTVEEKKLSSDDVTAEHADVAARLAAKRAIEHQYTTLLSRAQRIKDVLDIEAKLGEVR